MTPEQVQGAYERASSVVNGFRTVREQQARDVVALCAYVQALEHRLQRLKAVMQEQPGNQSYAKTFKDIFDDIFTPRS